MENDGGFYQRRFGFLGINLIRYLLAKGVTDIRTIDIADFSYPEADRINFLKADIRNPAFWSHLLMDVDISHTCRRRATFIQQGGDI